MPIPLNAEMLAAAYEYLCCQPPFSKWNLPPAEDIKFAIIRKKDRYAHYRNEGGRHYIEVSSRFVGRHEMLIATMAHELIHLHQELVGILGANPHDAAFHKLADHVCKVHEFDRLTF